MSKPLIYNIFSSSKCFRNWSNECTKEKMQKTTSTEHLWESKDEEEFETPNIIHGVLNSILRTEKLKTNGK